MGKKAQDVNLPSVPDINSTDNSREQPSIELVEPATYHATVVIKNETTPTGNIIGDEKQVGAANNQAPPTKQSAYQDPATIQHVIAPTTDLYTVPAKKQTDITKVFHMHTHAHKHSLLSPYACLSCIMT